MCSLHVIHHALARAYRAVATTEPAYADRAAYHVARSRALAPHLDPLEAPVAEARAMTAGGGAPGGTGMRFFQIGFRRCGTTALAAFFTRCGIPCIHHDQGRLARRMRANLAAGRPPLEGYDDRYRAFTNMDFQTPEDHFDGFTQFEALRAAYGGKFILNTRPVEHWLRSMMRRAGRARLRAVWVARFGTDDPARVADCWRAAWEAHHRRVRAEIPAERLLVFDIEADPPERLCDFVGVPRSYARFFTLENPSLNRAGEALDACLPVAVKRAVPDWIKYPVKKLLRKRRVEPEPRYDP